MAAATQSSVPVDDACHRAPAADGRKRPAQASTDWPEFAPPVAISDGPLGAIQAADREIARQTALRARAVAQFAASRPATVDRPQGTRGAMTPERWAARPEDLRPVSEWATQELAVALSLTSEGAETLMTRSLMLVHRLPGTLAALEAGALHPGHLWPLLEKVAPIADDQVRAEVEADLLRWAAGRVTTPGQLGRRARRVVATRDARGAARRLEQAIRERGIHVRPGRVDGIAELVTIATVPEFQAMYRTLVALAEAVVDDPDDPRTLGQKMVDCLTDLVLRPGESDTPPVQALLTVVASLATLAGGDEPGEIDGHVVPAGMIRRLVHGLAGTPAAEHELVPAPEPATTEFTAEPAAPDELADTTAAVVESAPTEPAAGEPLAPEPPPADRAARSTPDEPVEEIADSGWLEFEQQDLARWWDEMRLRVLAGEFDDPPPPGPGYPDEDLPPPDVPPAPGLESREPSVVTMERAREGGGWWAAADRAIDDAGLALQRADEALGSAQRMVRTAQRADADDEAAWRHGAPGRLTDAEDALAALRACTDDRRALLADLLARTGGGGLADRPRIALTDALTGALLALTDLPELRRAGGCGAPACRRTPESCTHDLTGRPGLGPPGPTDGYRPSAALDRWVRARDRCCRFPGCRRRVPKGGELDHDRPYPDGPTSASNLAGYCTTHHRGKHQAPGWTHRLDPDGVLTVTTPTGLTAVTTPPPY